MDSRLRDLINDYLKRVSEAIELMKLSGFELPISNNAWQETAFHKAGSCIVASGISNMVTDAPCIYERALSILILENTGNSMVSIFGAYPALQRTI
ncbi:hypothetical protein ABQD47_08555 [Providencia rettgeri]